MISILSKNGFRKAQVGEDADGVFINYYRPASLGDLARDDWRFVRQTRPALPFHAALDLADRIMNVAPPEVGAGAR